MNKKLTFSAFLFRLGDDYLAFLRNLTPTVLFFSLALFALPQLEQGDWNIEQIMMGLVSGGACFIAVTAMAVNIYSFCKKSLKALQELKGIDLTDPISFRQMVRLLWLEGDAKVLMFCFLINLLAIVMVLVYGINYAFNFYRTASSLAG